MYKTIIVGNVMFWVNPAGQIDFAGSRLNIDGLKQKVIHSRQYDWSDDDSAEWGQ